MSDSESLYRSLYRAYVSDTISLFARLQSTSSRGGQHTPDLYREYVGFMGLRKLADACGDDFKLGEMLYDGERSSFSASVCLLR
jgi:hypothetical protein